MRLQKGLYLVGLFGTALLLSGCASSVFPDFDEGNEVVIDDGGRVEVRQVEESGILIADKENAAYEDEDDDASDLEEEKIVAKPAKEVIIAEVEEVTPAKVIEVEKEEVAPVKQAEEKVVAEVKETVNVNEKAEAEDMPEPELAGPSMHYLAATVYFPNGGSAVDSSYRSSLKNIAKLVKENNAVVTVYGFASSRTRDTDPASHKLANFKVSAERARNTAKALKLAGVPENKITTQALSDTMPMYQEVMPEGERLNRRAEIYLTY